MSYPPEQSWKIAVLASSVINLVIGCVSIIFFSTCYGTLPQKLTSMIILANATMMIYTTILLVIILVAKSKFAYINFEIWSSLFIIFGTLVTIIFVVIVVTSPTPMEVFNQDIIYFYGVCFGHLYFAILHLPIYLLAYLKYKIGFWRSDYE
jgi:hypothetical protein